MRLPFVCLISAICNCCLALPPNIIVFYTDDHGHADLSCQGVLPDVKTPHIDALAASGVRAIHGYSTAPQCVPSRAGLLVGKFQSRFGVETNRSPLDGFNNELTIAERLKKVGYATAQFGKWHLGPTGEITSHGFDHVFAQNAQRPFLANITVDGQDRPMQEQRPTHYHVDGCSHAAASIIKRYRDQPFFLYIAYRAPHVPLDAPKKYLDRFPGEMPERRRQALAMISATDDGVGLVTQTLDELGLTERTLIFYVGDNGAPLKIHKADLPGGGPGWDGSLNDPLNGEKGMLSEGGMHVPFCVSWPSKIRKAQQYSHPISALDVAATAVAVSGAKPDAALDGVNLVPFLSGERFEAPHKRLMWRWGAQSAIREGQWKLLRGGPREYLYDLDSDLEEKNNLASQRPGVADRLRDALKNWTRDLSPPGLTTTAMSEVWNQYFDFYLEGKPAPPLRGRIRSGSQDSTGKIDGWIVRNGTLAIKDKSLVIETDGGFIAKSGLQLEAPVSLELKFASDSGRGSVSWRAKGDKDFAKASTTRFAADGSVRSQTVSVDIPEDKPVIHLRLRFPGKSIHVQSIDAISAGKRHQLWSPRN